MMIDSSGASVPDRALVNDAPPGHHPAGFDPSREMFFSRKEVAGTLAMWAVRQSPYVVPENLDSAIASMYDALPDGPGEWFFATEAQLRDAVEFICLNDQTIAAWNVPKSGHSAEIVFSSRYDGPAPDDDIIDLHALANNVCRTLLDDQAGYSCDSDGSPQGGDGEAGSVHDSAGRNGIATPPLAALNPTPERTNDEQG